MAWLLLGKDRVRMRKISISQLARLITVAIIAATHCSKPLVWSADNPTVRLTDFGARGDALRATAQTTLNSQTISLSTIVPLSAQDVGKVVLLFGAGPATTETNNQDLIATIVQVSGGKAMIDAPAGITATNIACIYGTDNARAFQTCIDSVTGTNTTIYIPDGNYLIMPPSALDRSFVMQNMYETHPAITLQKGGIHFVGESLQGVNLIGNGAWTLKGAYAYRGYMFALQGPVTNDAPVLFENLTFDGGAMTGNTSYNGFPARTTDGIGWDATHDAVLDVGPAPLHAYKAFRNCTFIRWKGEMLKSVADNTDGLIEISHCLFADGSASAFNFNFTHTIADCTFSNLFQVSEFYQAYSKGASSFSNNVVTNITGSAIAINGALAGRTQPEYNIVSNIFNLDNQFGILTTPAQNIRVIGNKFICKNGGTGVGLGAAGYQGSTCNSNITIAFNSFDGAYYAMQVLGSGANHSENVTVCSNSLRNCHSLAYGYGWGTNVQFIANTGTNIGSLDSSILQGQWYVDDPSNTLEVHSNWDYWNRTNLISYAFGMRHEITVAQTGSIWVLDDTRPNQMPAGSFISLKNITPVALRIYLSSLSYPNGQSMVLTNGVETQFRWVSNSWTMAPRAPQNFRQSN